MYRNGQGVTKDYSQALQWFRKAADRGNHVAILQMGVTYEKGWGVSKDTAQAIHWYRKAAELDANEKAKEYAKIALKRLE